MGTHMQSLTLSIKMYREILIPGGSTFEYLKTFYFEEDEHIFCFAPLFLSSYGILLGAIVPH